MKKLRTPILPLLLGGMITACSATELPILMKDPNARAYALVDALKYGLTSPEALSEWDKQRQAPVESLPFPVAKTAGWPLCDAKQLQQLKPDIFFTQGYRVAYVMKPEPCPGDKACVTLEMHASLRDDPAVMRRIESIVQAPCAALPLTGKQMEGFAYAPELSRKLLACERQGAHYMVRIFSGGKLLFEVTPENRKQ